MGTFLWVFIWLLEVFNVLGKKHLDADVCANFWCPKIKTNKKQKLSKHQSEAYMFELILQFLHQPKSQKENSRHWQHPRVSDNMFYGHNDTSYTLTTWVVYVGQFFPWCVPWVPLVEYDGKNAPPSKWPGRSDHSKKWDEQKQILTILGSYFYRFTLRSFGGSFRNHASCKVCSLNRRDKMFCQNASNSKSYGRPAANSIQSTIGERNSSSSQLGGLWRLSVGLPGPVAYVDLVVPVLPKRFETSARLSG